MTEPQRISTEKALRPRVLHLFNAYDVGGVERQHMLLLERLVGFEHMTWSYNHGSLEQELDCLGVPHCSGGVDVLAAMLENNRIDCVVVRTNRYLREVAPLLRETPARIVYFRNYLRWWEGNKTYFDNELESLAISMADHCLFSGPMLLDPVLEAGIEVPGGEIFHNGIDCHRFPLLARELPDSGPLRIGMLGNISRHKNQVDAVNVLAPLLRSGRLTLRIGGAEQDVSYVRQLHEAVEGLPVELCGYVADSVDFMSRIDILLHSSTAEGWPNVIMEAFASGVPVVSSDVGDIREEFGPDSPGRLFACGEYQVTPGLIDEVADRDVYRDLSAKAVARARQFDINTQAAKLSEIIHATLGRSVVPCAV